MSKNTKPFGGTLRPLVLSAMLVISPIFADAVPLPQERSAQVAGHPSKAVLSGVTLAGNRLVAVGERGIIILSDDNGTTWRQAKVPVGVSLTAVQFVDRKTGWATGHSGVVLRTIDGGQTWSKQLDAATANAIWREDAKRKLQAGEGAPQQLARNLADAERMVAEGGDKPFLDIHFTSPLSGYVIGAYNLIFRTDDGGENWTPWQDHVDNPQGFHLYAIGGDQSNLYIVGEQGIVFRSIDGGAKFSPVATPYKGSYFGFVSGQDGDLTAFGLRGNVYQSNDSGASWKKVEMKVPASLTGGIRLKDGRVVLVNQSGQVLVSASNHASFEAAPIGQLAPLSGVTQTANGDLIVVGMRGAKKISLASLTGSGK